MDIVERLRKRIDPDDPDLWVLDRDRIEAADEIEKLRAYLLGIAQGTNEEWTHDWALRAIETSDLFEQPKAPHADTDEIERLRKANAR